MSLIKPVLALVAFISVCYALAAAAPATQSSSALAANTTGPSISRVFSMNYTLQTFFGANTTELAVYYWADFINQLTRFQSESLDGRLITIITEGAKSNKIYTIIDNENCTYQNYSNNVISPFSWVQNATSTGETCSYGNNTGTLYAFNTTNLFATICLGGTNFTTPIQMEFSEVNSEGEKEYQLYEIVTWSPKLPPRAVFTPPKTCVQSNFTHEWTNAAWLHPYMYFPKLPQNKE